MDGKARKLIFWLLLLTGSAFGTVLAQYFGGAINPFMLLGILAGVSLGIFVIHFAKGPFRRWVIAILSALFIPVVITGIVTYILSLLGFDTSLQSIFTVYILGLLFIIFIAIRIDDKDFLRDVPEYDERQLHHFAWSSAWSFLLLFFLVIGALAQPWVGLDNLGLWIGVLGVTYLFWVINITVLGLRK
ncbi:hypothetical protein [Dethiobacter alkaliphilus]|uniref:Uncharacterized protein n=1 Tax=Dethiobacter alkaliphilus AHT 1 TaxID=555088 RepID=C0GEI6_DETAL|nr:hypothetical protein [Dethiobacter alkaliphilus]EEG78480.1 hypothetical protein DealDRAFT_0895 [Dethiobacter alkaliphilus AHT 1]